LSIRSRRDGGKYPVGRHKQNKTRYNVIEEPEPEPVQAEVQPQPQENVVLPPSHINWERPMASKRGAVDIVVPEKLFTKREKQLKKKVTPMGP
jgi:hypothetical protein